MTTLSAIDWIRLPLIYAHLLLCAFAITQVLRTDLAILDGRFTPSGLARAAHRVVLLLVALWITGLSLVFLDTGFDPATLAAKPKLLFKLLCVSVLTVNGIVLHAVAFPLVAGHGRLTATASLAVALSGAMSTGHWLLAVFVGTTEPLGRWSHEELMTGYALFLVLTALAGAVCAPPMRRRLLCWRAYRAAASARHTMPTYVDGQADAPSGMLADEPRMVFIRL